MVIGVVALGSAQTFSFRSGGLDWTGMCASGQSQTPIDLPMSPSNPSQSSVQTIVLGTSSDFTAVEYSSTPQPYSSFESAGFQLYNALGSVSAVLGGTQFQGELAQFHFHAPGMHTFDGLRYPVELHLVFTPSNDTDPGVVGLEIAVRFIEGGRSALVDAVISQGTIDLSPIVSELEDYYYYSGSFEAPTPDCLERDLWVVPSVVLELSQSQVMFLRGRDMPGLRDLVGHEAYREPQALNGRTIFHVVPSASSVDSFLAQ